jgi:hypothetical protein
MSLFATLNVIKYLGSAIKTGQMGVPVTEIEYDDADPEYIIGFDKAKLASILELN